MSFLDLFSAAASDLESSIDWDRVGGDAGACQYGGTGHLVFNTAGDTAYHCPDQLSANHSTKIIFSRNTSKAFFPACVRLTDSNNFIGYRNNGNHQLYLRNGGSFTLLGSSSGKQIIGAEYDLIADADNITLSENGVVLISATTSVHNAVTRQGLVARSTGEPNYITSFSADPVGGGTDVLINATVVSKTVEPQNAVIFVGLDTYITASTVSKTVEPLNAIIAVSNDIAIAATSVSKSIETFNADIFSGLDVTITASVVSKAIESLNAIITASTDTVIEATLVQKNIETFNASIFSGSDINISGSLVTKTVEVFNAAIVVGIDLHIDATVVSKVVEPQNAVIIASIDILINAALVTKNIITENAVINVGNDRHITASLRTKNVTAFNAEIFSGLDVHISGSLVTKTVETNNAIVASNIDLHITATVVSKIVEPQNAVILVGAPIAIVATVATKSVTSFNALISTSIDKAIFATVRNNLIETLPAVLFAGIDSNIAASAVSKLIDTFSAEVYAGTDTRISAGFLDKIVEPQNALVTGVGGALITANTATKIVHTFPAIIKPGNVITASVAEKTTQVFDAEIYTGALQATFVAKIVESKNAIVRMDVEIQASLIEKTIITFPATFNQQNAIQAGFVTKSITSFPALVSYGSALNISAGIVLKTVRNFNARITGLQSIGCAIEDLNLTIPHADFDADEQQRVLIENFIRIQDCIRALMKCCAKEVGTFINAFPAIKRVETRNAFIEQIVVSCIYEDFVSTRHGGGMPYLWLKLNDTGTPATITAEGFYTAQFAVSYSSFGFDNNIQFESSPVITQGGTTSLGFEPKYLEGDTVLSSSVLDYDSAGPLDTEIEFWAKLGDGPINVSIDETSTFIEIEWDGGTITATIETVFNGFVSVSSSSSYSTGDVVHVVMQFRDWGVLQDGQMHLHVNGVNQGFVNADGPYVDADFMNNAVLNINAGPNVAIPTYIDQLTFNNVNGPSFMNQQTILDTYNCGAGIVPLSYEDFVSIRHAGGPPSIWFKLNDAVGSTAIIDSGTFGVDGTTLPTVVFEVSPVITQSGTTGAIAPNGASATSFLSEAAKNPYIQPIEFEFWFERLPSNFLSARVSIGTAITLTLGNNFISANVAPAGGNAGSVFHNWVPRPDPQEKMHIVFQYYNVHDGTGGTLYLYINGVLIATDTTTSDMALEPDYPLRYSTPLHSMKMDQLTYTETNIQTAVQILETYNLGIKT